MIDTNTFPSHQRLWQLFNDNHFKTVWPWDVASIGEDGEHIKQGTCVCERAVCVRARAVCVCARAVCVCMYVYVCESACDILLREAGERLKLRVSCNVCMCVCACLRVCVYTFMRMCV